jgi:uncharacterized membrane protein
MNKGWSRRNKFWSAVAYLAAGLSVVALGVYVAFYPPKHGVSDRVIKLALITALVFGMLVKAYWRHRRLVKLWLVLVVMLLAHISILGFPLKLFRENWSILGTTIATTSELMLLMALMYWILGVAPDTRTSGT